MAMELISSASVITVFVLQIYLLVLSILLGPTSDPKGQLENSSEGLSQCTEMVATLSGGSSQVLVQQRVEKAPQQRRIVGTSASRRPGSPFPLSS